MSQQAHDQRIRLYVRLSLRLVFFILFALILIYALPYLLSLFAPFIAAFIIASLLNPLVSGIQKKTGVSRRLLSFFIVVIVCLCLVALVSWFIYSFAKEAVSLAKNIQAVWELAIAYFNLLTQKLTWLLDFFPGDTEVILSDLADSILLWLQTVSKNLADYVMGNTITVTTRLSSGIVTIIIFMIATYFITADYPKLIALMEKLDRTPSYRHLRIIKNASKSAFAGYIKAQFLLALLAFAVMFAALALYGQDYALLIALLLSVIDFLPIIGVHIVLIPWGLIHLANGDSKKGLFLLILSGSFFLVRRIAEPNIVGSQTGLPPLIALMSIYVGMKLAGVMGMILCPLIVLVFLSIIKAGMLDETVKDIKDAFSTKPD